MQHSMIIKVYFWQQSYAELHLTNGDTPYKIDQYLRAALHDYQSELLAKTPRWTTLTNRDTLL